MTEEQKNVDHKAPQQWLWICKHSKGDRDWVCEEVTDFDTRDNPLSWEEDAEWDEIRFLAYCNLSTHCV